MPRHAAAGLARRGLLAGAGAWPVLASLPGARAASLSADAVTRPVRHVSLAWPRDAATDVAVLVAVTQGLFAEYGLVADPVPVGSTAELAGLLRDGHADACVGPALQLLVPLQQGLDARMTTGISGGGLRLLAEHRSKLRHIEDVSHHRIGVAHLDGIERLFFSIMMRRKGVDPTRQVTWVAVEPGRMGDALRDTSVDAVAVGDAQGFFLREALKLTEIATNLSGSYRERTSNVLAVSGRLIARDRAAVVGLTRALLEAARWVAAFPDLAASVMAPMAPQLDVLDRARMLRDETPSEHPHGAALEEDIAADADELRLLGPLPYELNAGRFASSVCLDVLKG